MTTEALMPPAGLAGRGAGPRYADAGTLWQPASACGDRCRGGDVRRSSPVTVALRLAGAVVVLLLGLLPSALIGGVVLRVMSRALLRVLGVRMRWRGPAPRPGSLLVANHVSWLDVVALHAILPARMVAKHDVQSWPVIGETGTRTGAIYIDRTRPSRLPETVAEIAASLRAGRSVVVFPEGTTHCGPEYGRFRPALFQAAIDAGAPVVPVSVGYDSTEGAFLGEDTLGESILRVVRVRRLTLTLAAAPALRPAPGADRRVLARAAQSSLAGGGYHLAA